MPNIDEEITFGLELEIVRLSEEAPDIINRRGFQRRYDRTIKGHRGEDLPETGDLAGSEIITRPITVGLEMDQNGQHMRIDWREAQAIVLDLSKCAKEVNLSCGLHIHLGRPKGDDNGPFGVKSSKWTPAQQRCWVAIGALMEEQLFAVCPDSRKNNRYCRKIKAAFNERELGSFYPVGQVTPRKYDNEKRYCWLNLIETQRQGRAESRIGRGDGPATGTVEVRMLGNVRRFNYIWAWTQLWVKVASYVAYLPTEQAINQLIVCNAVRTEMETLQRIKQENQKAAKGGKTEKPDKTVPGPAEQVSVEDDWGPVEASTDDEPSF